MNADAHFVIGRTHMNNGKPCQDYAMAGQLRTNGAYAIVSDGCSSGGSTDIGARIVALATAKALRSMSAVPDRTVPDITNAVQGAQVEGFKLAENAFELTTQDLLATGNYVYADDRSRIFHIHGDGVVAFVGRNGELVLDRYEWADNTPAYPAYARDNYAGFLAYHGGNETAPKLTIGRWIRLRDGELRHYADVPIALGQGMRGFTSYFSDEFALVAIFSDGVTQIDGLDWNEAVIQLLNFKSTTGEFAKRRLNRFIRDGKAANYYPTDDLSYAVVKFDDADVFNQEES